MENKHILITGASGNVGYEIIRGLKEINSKHTLIAADYNPENAKKVLSQFSGLQYRRLDFTKSSFFKNVLSAIDLVFLLRPPNIADVSRYFVPFMDALEKEGIKQIVFLSVQGVESQKMIPHYKIEQLILERGLDYVFLRPGYFMQNLTTTLLHEIKTKNKIFIPSGPMKMNWVDARDIGLVGAHVLHDFEKHGNKAYEITGSDFAGFDTAARLISEETGKHVEYESPGLIKFYRSKRKLGIPRPMIFVMIMLHFLPRFGKNQQRLTDTVRDITGKDPIPLKEFVKRERNKF